MIRLIGYFFGVGAFLVLGVAAVVAVYLGSVAKDLPDYEVLNSYAPPVTTRVHAGNGALMAEYARERRLYLPIQAIPDRVKAAFISAEDKNFYQHPGVDITGLGRAIFVNLQNFGSGRRPVGASTITQQVAKNFLLTADQTIDRKIKEAILSFRIEQAYCKDRILELYLNEIFFGLNSYGIAGAALTYFDKSGDRTDDRRNRLSGGPCRRDRPTTIPSASRKQRWSAATGLSIAWSRMAMSPRTMAKRPRSSRWASTLRRSPAPIFSPRIILPKKCAARSSSDMATTRSMKAACRSAPRLIRTCRS